MSKQLVKHKGDFFEKVTDNPLIEFYKKVPEPEAEVVKELPLKWKGPKIPFSIWKDIVDWCVWSYDKVKAETLVFLFFDEQNTEDPWSYWIPPQKTQGMTVQSDPDHKDFNELRAEQKGIFFGTVHHHCSGSAFASAVDKTDELNKDGLHFTIGFCDKPEELNAHCRITLAGTTQVIPYYQYVELPVELAKIIAQTKELKLFKKIDWAKNVLPEYFLTASPDWKGYEWKDIRYVQKPAAQTKTYGHQNTAKKNQQQHLGLGAGLTDEPSETEYGYVSSTLINDWSFGRNDDEIIDWAETFVQDTNPKANTDSLVEDMCGDMASMLEDADWLMSSGSDEWLDKLFESFDEALPKYANLTLFEKRTSIQAIFSDIYNQSLVSDLTQRRGQKAAKDLTQQ